VIATTESISKERAEQIFNQYSDFVYKIALFLVKSKTQAEDITQETFIQVFKKYHLYDLKKPIEPWIYKITVNISHNMYRKNRWLSFIGQYQDQQSNELLEDIFFKDQEKAELWEKINNLSQKSREVIVLHFYLGMKLNEVSTALDIPLGTCKSRLNTALNALRKNLTYSTRAHFIKGGEYNETV
jgi:RNA polymerase sigma-70 factor (ECF subfamily)